MITTTRLTLLAALVATTLASGLVRATAQSQQGNPDDDWCRDSRDTSRGDDRVTYCEVRAFTVPASGATLTVDAAPNGGISVEGMDRADVLVRARVQSTARTMEQARAIASRIEVVATADRVQANGPGNMRDNENWSVSYRIAAPRATNLSLRSTNGGISVTNVRSEMQLRTVNGGLNLSHVGGTVEGRTSNGGVKVALDGTTWDGQGLDVSTSNGGVTLDLPENYSARLEAGTVNGGLNIDFPITVSGSVKKSIAADIGGGGPTLRIKTDNGGVHIRKRNGEW